MREPMSDDLRAFGEASTRDLPPIEWSVEAGRIRSRRAGQDRRRGIVVTIVVLALLLAVPIPYSRTTGHDLELVVGGALEPALRPVLEAELRDALGLAEIRTTSTSSAAGETWRFASSVSDRSGVNVEEAVHTLAGALERRGYAVRTSVVPRRERVSGSLYALAREQVIRVRGDGRSAAEVEREILRRLDDAGLGGTGVSVTDEGGMRRIEVDRPGAGAPGALGIELGAPADSLGAAPTRIAVERIAASGGGHALRVEVTRWGRTHVVEVPRADALGDAELAREIESRLRAAGLEARVKFERGMLQIEAR